MEAIKAGRCKAALGHAEKLYDAKMHTKSLLEQALSQEEAMERNLVEFERNIAATTSFIDEHTK